MSLQVGIVGLGIMGGSFARNLLVDGHSVIGYDILEKNIDCHALKYNILDSDNYELVTSGCDETILNISIQYSKSIFKN